MIREIADKELPVCLDVIHQSFSTVAHEFGLTCDNCPTNGAFMPLSRLEDDYRKGNQLFGMYEDDALVGCLALVNKSINVFELEKLAVLPVCRHKGYGSQLVEFARCEARRRGAKMLTVGIIEENRLLKEWYMKKGFVHTGTAKFPHLPFTVGFMEMAL